MKNLTNENRNWAVAAAFAEAGEWDTAREMIPEGNVQSNEVGWLQRIFVAITFAEADMAEEAVAMMYPETAPVGRRQVSFEEELGLKGAYITLGVVALD